MKKVLIPSFAATYHKRLVLHPKLLHPRPIQLPQQAHDAALLAPPGRTIHQQVGEVTTLNLKTAH